MCTARPTGGFAVPVVPDGTEERLGALLASVVAVKVFLGLGVADVIQLDQHCGHRCRPQHPEPRLAHALVGASGMFHQLLLRQGGEVEAAVQMHVARQLEDDVRLGAVGVEPPVGGRVVVLQLHHGVLAHGHAHVLLGLVGAEGVYAGAVHRRASGALPGHRVDVDADEEVAFLAVGDVGALLEGEEIVAVAGEDYAGVRTSVLYLVR